MKASKSIKNHEELIQWGDGNHPSCPTREQLEPGPLADEGFGNDPGHHETSGEDQTSSPEPGGCRLHAEFSEDGTKIIVTPVGCSFEQLQAVEETVLEVNQCEDEE
jgi:hypothetical protein